MPVNNDYQTRRGGQQGLFFNGLASLILGLISIFGAWADPSGMGAVLRVFIAIQGIVLLGLGGWSIRRYLIQRSSGVSDLNR